MQLIVEERVAISLGFSTPRNPLGPQNPAVPGVQGNVVTMLIWAFLLQRDREGDVSTMPYACFSFTHSHEHSQRRNPTKIANAQQSGICVLQTVVTKETSSCELLNGFPQCTHDVVLSSGQTCWTCLNHIEWFD